MIDIGRNVVSQPAISTGLEWLVANGIGGYASGTLSGVLSRRYQGLLVAALNPPTERTTLVSKVDETLIYADQAYPLFSNQWNPDPDSITPQGYTLLNRFFLDVGLPVWEYSIADAILEKRVWMAYGHNTTYVRYMLVRGNLPATLNAKVLVNYKDFHANTQGGAWHMSISAVTHGLRVNAFDGATPFYLLSADAAIDPLHEWYYNYYLNREAYRGLDATGDHLLAGEARFTLQPSESVTLVFSTDPDAPLDSDAAYQAAHQRQIQLIEQAQASSEPDWIQQLVLAADQFIVQRRAGDNPDGRSVIAGYPWFSDWGRDTMISLPGLTLNTGRQAEAALILEATAFSASSHEATRSLPFSRT
jgi:predicted glycogen debranching enzyme